MAVEMRLFGEDGEVLPFPEGHEPDPGMADHMDLMEGVLALQAALRRRVEEGVAQPSLREALEVMWGGRGWSLRQHARFVGDGGWHTFTFGQPSDPGEPTPYGVSAAPNRVARLWEESPVEWRRGELDSVAGISWAQPTLSRLLRWIDGPKPRWQSMAALKGLLTLEGRPDPATVDFFVALGAYDMPYSSAGVRAAAAELARKPGKVLFSR